VLTELALDGVLFAPIVLYGLVAGAITLLLRAVIWRTGLAHWLWHLPLLEVALYVCVLSLLVAYY
jgi:protein AaeX